MTSKVKRPVSDPDDADMAEPTCAVCDRSATDDDLYGLQVRPMDNYSERKHLHLCHHCVQMFVYQTQFLWGTSVPLSWDDNNRSRTSGR